MKSSFRLGRILGFEIGIHVSWLFIFVFLTWTLAVGYFPLEGILAGRDPVVYWLLGAASSLSLFASVLAHEIGHSIVARRNGIPVKSITLFLFGGVSNLTKEADTAGAEFKMAVTGPLVSFGLSAIFFTMYFAGGQAATAFSAVVVYLAQINLILGAFNLLPGFPLDGGRVFRAIIWHITKDYLKATKIASSTGQIIAYIFIFGGIALAFVIGIGGLWLALVGWFLASAATASYQQTVLGQTLKGVKVSDVARTNVITISDDLTVEQAMSKILTANQRALPIIRNDRLEGLVTITDVKKVPRESWAAESVRQIMRMEDQVQTIRADAELSKALEIMQKDDYNQLPVMQDGKLYGLISRSDVLQYIQFKLEVPQG